MIRLINTRFVVRMSIDGRSFRNIKYLLDFLESQSVSNSLLHITTPVEEYSMQYKTLLK